MDNSLFNQLKEQFTNSQHLETIGLCDQQLKTTPDDIAVLYCYATAAILSGNTEIGFNLFEKILNSVTTKNQVESSELEFVARTSLQVADFISYLNDRNKEDVFSKSTEYANRIAGILNNPPLQTLVDSYKNRIMVSPGGSVHIIPRSPDTLQIEPTNHCNLKCTMCPRSSMTRDKGYIKTALWEKTIQGWSGRKQEQKIHHIVFDLTYTLSRTGGLVKMFFMGEPLLHPEFDTLIKTAKNLGCTVGLQTNGMLLKKKSTMKRLLEACPDAVILSLDGINPNSYDEIRKGGNWEDIKKIIADLYQSRKEMGFENNIAIDISTIVPEETDQHTSNALAFIDPVRPFLNNINIIELDRSYNPSFIAENGGIKEYSREKLKFSPEKPLCEEPLEKLNVLWDGTVTPCCNDISGNIKLGDSTTQTIDDIWNNKKTKDLQTAIIKHDTARHPICDMCRYK